MWKKWLLSCRAWNCQGIGHVCYLSKTQTTTTGHPEVYEFMDILQQCLVLPPCPQMEQREKEKKKVCFCQTDAVCGIHAMSHFSVTGSKERGNSFRSVERRWKTDPSFSTSTLNAQLHAWCGQPAKYTMHLKMQPIDSNKPMNIISPLQNWNCKNKGIYIFQHLAKL